MISRMRTGGSILFSALILLLLSPFQVNTETGKGTSETAFLRIEKKLLVFINRERQKKGLTPLVLFNPLNRIAGEQSRKMAISGRLSHFLPGSGSLGNRLREARLFFSICGENLVLSDLPVASVIHDEIMHSSPHRANVLNPDFSHCGIKIYSRGKQYYLTQDFARLFDPSTDKEAEFHFQEDLEIWFVKTFNYRFVFHRQSVDWARQMSRQTLKGKTASKPVKKWANLMTFRMANPDLNLIREKLQEEIMEVKLEAISIGVASGKTRESPSGTYAVSALLFGDYYHRLSPVELSRIFLNRLNQLRTGHHLPVLKTDADLSQQAARIVESTPAGQSGARRIKNGTILIIFMTNPHIIPPEIRKPLLSPEGSIRTIGIAIHQGDSGKKTGQGFRVCLILKQ